MGFLKKHGGNGGIFGGTTRRAKTFKKHGGDNGAEHIPDTVAAATASALLGEGKNPFQAFRDSIARQAEEARRKMFANIESAFQSPTAPTARGPSPYEIWQQELADEAASAERQLQNYLDQQIKAASPLERFLWGEMVSVTSSNVDQIQYDRELSVLYVIFKNGGWYRYWTVSIQEATSFFNSGSKGGWVWGHLRERGTVFGHKKNYEWMGFNLGSYYTPKYANDPTWQAEHAAIPASGEIPATWLKGTGPYSVAWIVGMNPKLFPKATVLGSGKAAIGQFPSGTALPTGTFLGKF